MACTSTTRIFLQVNTILFNWISTQDSWICLQHTWICTWEHHNICQTLFNTHLQHTWICISRHQNIFPTPMKRLTLAPEYAPRIKLGPAKERVMSRQLQRQRQAARAAAKRLSTGRRRRMMKYQIPPESRPAYDKVLQLYREAQVPDC